MTLVVFAIFGAFVPMYGVHTLPSDVTNISVKMCWSYDGFRNTYYPKEYAELVEVFFFVSIVPMVVSYFLIDIQLWRNSLVMGRKKYIHTISTAHSGLAHIKRKIKESVSMQTSVNLTSRKNLSLTYLSTSQEFIAEDLVSADFGLSNEDNMPASSSKMEANTSCPSAVPYHTSSKSSESKFLRFFTHSQASSIAVFTIVKKMKTHSIKEKSVTARTTRMMAVITLIYVVIWVPHLIVRLTRTEAINLCDEFTKCEQNNLYALALRSYYLSSGVNAFIYSICSVIFRVNFRRLVKKSWSKLVSLFKC
ncbi:hypothetical protein ACOMHN_001969 [Nucella lapillus]